LVRPVGARDDDRLRAEPLCLRELSLLERPAQSVSTARACGLQARLRETGAQPRLLEGDEGRRSATVIPVLGASINRSRPAPTDPGVAEPTASTRPS
jgi:hypothetical protein